MVLDIKGSDGVYPLIVEEALDFYSNESKQEELYLTSKKIDRVLQETAILVARGDVSDFDYRNYPIMIRRGYSDDAVALIDTEHMDGAIGGFFGNRGGNRGLIGCVSKKHLNVVTNEARLNGVAIGGKSLKRRVDERLKELEEDRKAREFYMKNNISIGNESITVDVQSLGFTNLEESLSKGTQTFTFEDVVHELVKLINEELRRKNDPNQSLKENRTVRFREDATLFKKYGHLGVTKEDFINCHTLEGVALLRKKRWICQIIDKFHEKGIIHRINEMVYDYDYSFQV